jgi:hypothetical protein
MQIPDHSLALLVVAMIRQAVYDAQNSKHPVRAAVAAAWLVSTGYPMLDVLCDRIVEPETWCTWVQAGCPTHKRYIGARTYKD